MSTGRACRVDEKEFHSDWKLAALGKPKILYYSRIQDSGLCNTSAEATSYSLSADLSVLFSEGCFDTEITHADMGQWAVHTFMRSKNALIFVALLLVARSSDVGAVKWPFTPPTQAPKQQVKVSFDDESFSFWDPFKNTGFNASATILPVAEEVAKRTPGYLAYATLTTGLGLFLPPQGAIAVNIAYVAAAIARSHEDVETFCKDEGRVLLGCPSLHLALVGGALRALRFRTWRRLFVKATLFRLRYQLRFMRIYRPQWISKGAPPLRFIVRDTAHAARNVQGLFPDLCHQAALIAGGFQLPFWSEISPPLRVEKGLGMSRRLDRRLQLEFGTRARRVRPGDDYPLGPGLLGWRIPHRLLFRATRVCGRMLSPSAREATTPKRKRSPRATRVSRMRRMKRVAVNEDRDTTPTETEAASPKDTSDIGLEEATEISPREMAAELAGFAEVDAELESGVVDDTSEELPEEDKTTIAEGVRGGSQQQEQEQEQHHEGRIQVKNAMASDAIPADAPVIRLHNVTAVPSRGSTLTKSYRALAELPYGDGRSDPEEAAARKGGSRRAWSNRDRREDEVSSPIRKLATLQPVVVKRNVPRQVLLADDDIAAARRTLRRMSFKAEIDLHLSGVISEVSAAVERAGDLRCEAESIEKIRSNLARAGMLGSAVGVPEVVCCPALGPLARRRILVTTALRGVDVSDSYVMEHAAAHGEKERSRFVEGLFAAFGQMCLGDGCFPSNPMPENLLYMYSGQVGLTDLSSVSELTEEQRNALCRLYRTMAELKGEDAANPSDTAEAKARAAMEGVGLVIDLPPAGGIAWNSWGEKWNAQEAAAAGFTAAAENMLAASLGEEPREEEGEEEGRADQWSRAGEEEDVKTAPLQLSEEEKKETEHEEATSRGKENAKMEVVKVEDEDGPVSPPPATTLPPPPSRRAQITHLMLLRGLFDTQRDDALALMGGGGKEFLKGMAVRRLPQAMTPVLRMVASLRGVCSHLDEDQSLLPGFSRAASKALSWRRAFTTSRGGAVQETGASSSRD